MENTHATDPLSSPVCVLQDAVSQNRAPRKNLIQNGVPKAHLSFQVETTSALDPRLIL
jgi:hypothetical protein